MEIKDSIKQILDRKKINGDIYIEESSKTEITVNDEKIETIQQADSFGMGIRIFKNGKMGFGYATVKGTGDIEKLISDVENAAYIEGYEKYRPISREAIKPIHIKDPEHQNITIEKKKEMAFELEKAVKNYSRSIKFVRDTTFSDISSKISYINTSGADHTYDSSYYYMHTTAISSDGREQQAVDGMDGSCLFSELDGKALGMETAERAKSLLGGKPVKSARYSIILPPHTGVEFLELLSSLFLAGNVRKGKSLLKDFAKGEKIASELLTIRDDAMLDHKIGSYMADGEGVAGKNKTVVERGNLSTFLYDRINAAYFKTESTGNSLRSGYKNLPDCGVSNFYIPAGSCSVDDAFKGESGIIVDSMMGLHTADTISGNFSLGINGWLVENGERKGAVNEVLISGNIKDLLMNISCVCDDLKFYFNYGAPTLVINDVQIAGK